MQIRLLNKIASGKAGDPLCRMLDNRYAILFIRGELPVMDLKYDILKHPNVSLTADGSTGAYGKDLRLVYRCQISFENIEKFTIFIIL